MLNFKVASNVGLTNLAECLINDGGSQEVLKALDEEVFESLEAIRDFVLTVGSQLKADQIHAVANGLINLRLEKSDGVRNMLAQETLARSFFAYELVHNKENAVEYLSTGFLAASFSVFAIASIFSKGGHVVETAMPEIAFFLFNKEGHACQNDSSASDVSSLTKNRKEKSDQARFLNMIDSFIIKYFVAELDEIRLPEANIKKKMDDERGGYRGGRKVSVGLDIRASIISGQERDLEKIFTKSLESHGITEEQFFESTSVTGSGPRSFIKPELEILLAGKATARKRWW